MRSVPDSQTSANHPSVTPQRVGLTRLAYARQLRDSGLSVFPLPRGSKIPTIAWKPLQDRLATDAELEAWFPPGEMPNLGLVTGRVSNVVVVDADTPAAIAYLWPRLPPTPWQTKTARGRHFYFTHPGGIITNRGTDLPTSAGPLPIHIRADGGYVLLRGRHPNGTAFYSSSVSAPRPALPIYNSSWLPTNKVAGDPQANGVTSPVTRSEPALDNAFIFHRARLYLAAIPPPVIGAGSDTLTLKAACRLVRGLNLSPSDAEELLWEWAGGRPGWTRDWITAKVQHAEKYGKEPIGGLR